MTDIVERLREFAGPRYPDDICGKLAMGEAADEIERLRRRRNRLAADLAQAHRDIGPWIARVGQLIAALDQAEQAMREAGAIYGADAALAALRKEIKA
jgi:hypothetical protein